MVRGLIIAGVVLAIAVIGYLMLPSGTPDESASVAPAPAEPSSELAPTPAPAINN